MNKVKLHMREEDGQRTPDVCGTAIDLINPQISESRKISLAVIYVDPGKNSKTHYHKITEEIYYFLEGSGRVIVGDAVIPVSAGSSVFIPIFTHHHVINDSNLPLRFLSADAPPFDETDIYFP